MIDFLVAYLVLLCISACAWIGHQYTSGRHDLLSFRNVFVLGFLYFQPLSVVHALWYRDFGKLHLQLTQSSALAFSGMATLFLLLLFWWSRKDGRLLPNRPTANGCDRSRNLLIISGLSVVIAAIGRLAIHVPLLNSLADCVGTAAAITAVGCAWAAVLRSRFALAVLLLFTTISVACLMVLLSGAFGRRGLLGIGVIIVWVTYYHTHRSGSKPTATAALPLFATALIALAMIPALGLFGSTREHQNVATSRTALEHVDEMLVHGSVEQGLAGFVNGQYAGAATLWIIESYPRVYQHEMLGSLKYFLVYPVPREYWPTKPWPLSVRLPIDAQMQGVKYWRYTHSTGLIGHIAADGGWPVLPLYALLLAIGFRKLDKTLATHRGNPIMVTALGAGLGELIAMPRGDSSRSAWIFVFSTMVMYALGRCSTFAFKQRRRRPSRRHANLKTRSPHVTTPKNVEVVT